LPVHGVAIQEHHCEVRAAAEQFPEICAAEADFLREVLQRDLQRDSYIPDGCNACQYTITLRGPGRRSDVPDGGMHASEEL